MPWSPVRIVLVVAAFALLGVGFYAARQWIEDGDRFVAVPDPPATAERLDDLRRAGFPVWWLGRSWHGTAVSGATLGPDGRTAVVRYGTPDCDADACRYPLSVLSRRGAEPLVVATGGAERPGTKLLRRLR